MSYKRKFSISLKEIFLFILVFSLTYFFLNLPNFFKTTETRKILYNGAIVTFRKPLEKALKIPVYPSEEKIREILFNSNVSKVTIYFKTAKDISIYAVEAFEIAFKLLNYTYPVFNMFPKFDGKEVSSYSQVNSSKQNPAIVLIHPEFANSTFVRAEDHKIIISGTDNDKLDLATIRFLIAAMNIKLK